MKTNAFRPRNIEDVLFAMRSGCLVQIDGCSGRVCGINIVSDRQSFNVVLEEYVSAIDEFSGNVTVRFAERD